MSIPKLFAAFAFSLNLLAMEVIDNTPKEHQAFLWFDSSVAGQYYQTLDPNDPNDLVLWVTFSIGTENQQVCNIARSKLKKLATTFDTMIEDVQGQKKIIHLQIPPYVFKFMAWAYYAKHEMGIKVSAAMFDVPLLKIEREELLRLTEKLDSTATTNALLFCGQLDYLTLIKNIHAIVVVVLEQRSQKPELEQYKKNKELIKEHQAILFYQLIMGDPLDEHHKQLLESISKNKLALLLPYPRGEALQFLKTSEPAREIICNLLSDLFWEDLLYQNFGTCARPLADLISKFWKIIPYVDENAVPIVQYDPVNKSGKNFYMKTSSAAEAKLLRDLNDFLRTFASVLDELVIKVKNTLMEKEKFSISLSFSNFTCIFQRNLHDQIGTLRNSLKSFSSEEIELFKALHSNIYNILLHSDTDTNEQIALINNFNLAPLFIFPKEKNALVFLKTSPTTRSIIIDVLAEVFLERSLNGTVGKVKGNHIVRDFVEKFWAEGPYGRENAPYVVYLEKKKIFYSNDQNRPGAKKLINDLNTFKDILKNIGREQGIKIEFTQSILENTNFQYICYEVRWKKG